MKASIGMEEKPGLACIAGRKRTEALLHGRTKYFIMYTVAFAVCALFVFSWYFLSGKTFIWEGDGWKQHYKALVYYAKYLRSILRGLLFEHQLTIPNWDFSLGEGNDILGTLHYYVIGDPFCALSVFVPTRFLHIFYDAMMLMRLYLSGIAFSCLCLSHGQDDKCGVLAGALTYVFCYWGVHNATRHPFFLTPMLCLPLLLLGIGKILKKERPYVFILSVALSAASNFYFFYMLVLVAVIYVALKLLASYRRRWKEACLMLFRIGTASILGVLLAAVIVLPVLYTVLNDARMPSGNQFQWLYPQQYYNALPGVFLAGGGKYWICMGFSIPAFLALCMLFWHKKTNGLLKVYFLLCILAAIFPVVGQVFNGFSYMSNRWSWALALTVAYTVTAMWPSLMKLSRREGIFLLGCFAVYLFACLVLEESCKEQVLIALGLMFAFLCVAWLPGVAQKRALRLTGARSLLWRRGKQAVLLLLILAGFCNNSFWRNASKEQGNHKEGYAQRCMDRDKVQEEFLRNETMAVKQMAAIDGMEGFYRFSGSGLTQNANMAAGLSSTQYYWSFSNPYVAGFRRTMEMEDLSSYNYKSYGERASLLSLASVRYYVVPAGSSALIPYGFDHMGTVDVGGPKYTVYRNAYAMPLSYTYGTYVPAKEWEKLTAVEKQEALLQACVLKEDAPGVEKAELEFTNKVMDSKITCKGKGVRMEGDSFLVTSKKGSVKLEFEGLSDSETYVMVKNLHYAPQYEAASGKSHRKAPSRVMVVMKSSTGTRKTFLCQTKQDNNYTGRHDFTVNFGYSKEKATSVTIKFPSKGRYSFDSIQAVCQPMQRYGAQLGQLRANALEDVVIDAGKVTGRIALDKPKLLCFAIPYSKGWSAYVDGKEAELFQANSMYLACALTAGEHKIRLVYHTPLLREGAILSGIAALVFVGMLLIKRKGDSKKV
ncbi:YfhO family protein [Lachnospiraceae bacterium 29-84]